MINLYGFIMNVFTTYSFIFVFKKLVGNPKLKILSEIKYLILIATVYISLDSLSTKTIKLWVYYMMIELSLIFLYKEIYKEKKFEFFLHYIITFWVFQIADIIKGVIISKWSVLGKVLVDNITLSMVIPQVMVIIISTLLARILIFIKNIDKKRVYMKKNRLFWIYTNLMISLYMVFIHYYNKASGNQIIIIVSIFVICLFLFISYFAFIVLNSMYVEKNIRNYVEIYNDVIEESLYNMKVYRHDQKNILLSIGGFLEKDDIVGLKKYFYESINKSEKVDNKNLDGLVNIKNRPVKGLIYAKIASADSAQINLNIDIKNEIEEFFIKDIDMCKILGILIDNAIESCVESKEKLLNIGIWNDESEIYIVVSNSFKEKPKIYKIFEKGYSTKGRDRGLGLNIVKGLNEKTYQNMDMNIKIEDELFIMELIIEKED